MREELACELCPQHRFCDHVLLICGDGICDQQLRKADEWIKKIQTALRQQEDK